MKRLPLITATMLLLVSYSLTANVAQAAEKNPQPEQTEDINEFFTRQAEEFFAQQADEDALALLNNEVKLKFSSYLNTMFQVFAACPTASLNSTNISNAFNKVGITDGDAQLEVFRFARRQSDKLANPFAAYPAEQACEGAANGYGVDGKFIPGALDFK